MSVEQDLIDAYIRAHGVTRCPAACATETTAGLSSADRRAHQQRDDDAAGQAWHANQRSGWARYWAVKRARRANPSGKP